MTANELLDAHILSCEKTAMSSLLVPPATAMRLYLPEYLTLEPVTKSFTTKTG